MTGVRRSTRPLVQPCSIGNKGGTLHRSLFGPKPVDSASKRLQHMGQSRSSVLLSERNDAFSDILHTNPHLVGRSHPVSVEVREFDWDSSRKGASQLPRTKTIRLSTPKTTTGENLILGYTSPLKFFCTEAERSIEPSVTFLLDQVPESEIASPPPSTGANSKNRPLKYMP